jgi:hypothetical protein
LTYLKLTDRQVGFLMVLGAKRAEIGRFLAQSAVAAG